MPNVNEIMAAMAEANEALLAKPGLEQRIADLMDELAITKHQLEAKHEQTLSQSERIDELNTKVARLEVERDEAGFRELEALEKLDHVKQTLGMLINTQQGLLSEVSPKATAEASGFFVPADSQSAAPEIADLPLAPEPTSSSTHEAISGPFVESFGPLVPPPVTSPFAERQDAKAGEPKDHVIDPDVWIPLHTWNA
jgi:uncharacterized small protein (DUF1192 family)